MSKFNTPKRVSTKTRNLAGGPAYSLKANIELVGTLVTTFLQDKYYEKGDERMVRIAELATKCDPEFVARAAVWARTEGYMRSAPLYLTAILAGIHNGDDLVRRTVRKVVNRADEIAELLAAYESIQDEDSHSFSHQLMKGLGDAFNKFDEYQFSKYNRAGKFRLKDALFLVHPVAKDAKQKKLFDKIAKDTLKTAETWETTLTAVGEGMADSSESDKLEAKGEAWATLIEENKLGHMALLRNLRNILDNVKDKKTIASAADALSNEEAVLKGKQFPFRYYAAYNEIEGHANPHTGLLLDAIDEACGIAAGNIPGFGRDTSVAIWNDVSGSMSRNISEKSKIQGFEVGLMLGVMMKARCKDSVLGCFATGAQLVSIPSKGGIIENCKTVIRKRPNIGMGTDGYAAIGEMIEHNVIVDKVLVITDMQLYGGVMQTAWKQYKKIAPDAKLYIIDVAGYGATPVSTTQDDVYYIAGWNEKVFTLLDMVDNGEKIVKMIGQIEL